MKASEIVTFADELAALRRARVEVPAVPAHENDLSRIEAKARDIIDANGLHFTGADGPTAREVLIMVKELRELREVSTRWMQACMIAQQHLHKYTVVGESVFAGIPRVVEALREVAAAARAFRHEVRKRFQQAPDMSGKEYWPPSLRLEVTALDAALKKAKEAGRG